MSGDYLESDDGQHGTLVPWGGSDRPFPSQLRGDLLFVEPVALRCSGCVDEAGVRAEVEQVRRSLLEEYGFAPREIGVEVVPRAAGECELVVHGEVVDLIEVAVPSGDWTADSLRTVLARHLHRMLGTDDLVDLLAFARLQSPVAVDQVVPHQIGLGLLLGILRRLLREDVPIKPLHRIVEVIGSSPAPLHDVESLTARVRQARARTLVQRATQQDGTLRVVGLAAEAEHACYVLTRTCVGGLEDERVPKLVERLAVDLSSTIAAHDLRPCVLVCARDARAQVERVVRRSRPGTTVLTREEIAVGAPVEVAVIGAGIRVAERAPVAPPPPPSGVWSSHVEARVVQGSDVHEYDVTDVEIIE